MDFNELGPRLKQLRSNANLNQEQVCEKIGIANVQTLSAYETGKSTPTLQNLAALSALYQVSVDYLLFGSVALDSPPHSKEFYIHQLVEAADCLHLPLSKVALDKDDCNVFLTLSLDEYTGLESFARRWSRLRSLLDSKTLEAEEYRDLISQKLSKLEIKPNPVKQAQKELKETLESFRVSLLDEQY